MNVAIYARVSTKEQAEHGYSLETQIEACKQKAVELGAVSIKVYTDDVGGGFLERPGLDDLRDALSAKIHDTVIIYDQDRLARDTMILLLITEEIEKNATLIYVNSEYNKTPEGMLFYKIKGSFAEYEKLKILDRMNRGRRGKLKSGKPLKEYKIYGYDFIDGQYVVNEKEAELVNLIFKLYLDGNSGVSSIPDKLYNMGIVSLSGKKFHVSTIHKILSHQHYTGTYYSYRTYHKKTGVNNYKVFKRDSSEWIKMTCPRIVEQDIYEAVQDKLARNRSGKIRETKCESVFQGLLYCEACGHKMRLTRYKTAMYYACGKNRDNPGSCISKMIRIELLDDILWRTICTICKSESTLKKYLKQNHQPQKQNTENIAEQLEQIAKKRNAIMNWFSANLISMEVCTQKLEILKKQESVLTSKLQTEKEEKPIDTSAIVKIIKVKNADFETKRNIVTKIISAIYTKKEGDSRKDYSLNFNIIFR